MTMPRSLLLVPNHSMLLEAGAAWLESAEADMLRGLRAELSRAGIAAFVTRVPDPNLRGVVRDSEAQLHPLNWLEHAQVWKLINYVVAAVTLPFVVRRYDLVYIFCPGYCGSLAAFWARVLGRRYGLYVRGTWLNRRAATSFWWARVFTGASFMIVTGESFRRRLARYCGNVVNEVPLTALRPVDVDGVADRYRCPHRLLFAGRLTRSKGIFDAVRAVAILRSEGRTVELTIAGGGSEKEVAELREMCAESGVTHSVTILGHLPPAELASTYRDSAVFVFPSYYAEGFPRVLYEAMMFSLPIVTCEMPGTEGFLIDGANCLNCSPSDPEQLAGCIRRLLDDPALGHRLGSCARADVERLYASFTEATHGEQLLRFVGSM